MYFIKGLQQNTRIWSYKCRRSCTLDHVFVLLFYCSLQHMFCFRLRCTELQKRNTFYQMLSRCLSETDQCNKMISHCSEVTIKLYQIKQFMSQKAIIKYRQLYVYGDFFFSVKFNSTFTERYVYPLQLSIYKQKQYVIYYRLCLYLFLPSSNMYACH